MPRLPGRFAALAFAVGCAATDYNVTNQVGFLTDDPDSLTDLTLLGS